MANTIDKTAVNVSRIADESRDFAYWQSQPYSKRLEALEMIRQEYHRWTNDAEQGFQRVYKVTQLK